MATVKASRWTLLRRLGPRQHPPTRSTAEQNQSAPSLLGLSAELRNRIYEYTLAYALKERERSFTPRCHVSSDGHQEQQPGLLRTCKQIRSEALSIWYESTIFLSQVTTEKSDGPLLWLSRVAKPYRKLINSVEPRWHLTATEGRLTFSNATDRDYYDQEVFRPVCRHLDDTAQGLSLLVHRLDSSGATVRPLRMMYDEAVVALHVSGWSAVDSCGLEICVSTLSKIVDKAIQHSLKNRLEGGDGSLDGFEWKIDSLLEPGS